MAKQKQQAAKSSKAPAPAKKASGGVDKPRKITEPTAEIRDGVLYIAIPCEKRLRPSGSGKTLIVATTGGNKGLCELPDGRTVTIGLNAYVKPEGGIAPTMREEPEDEDAEDQDDDDQDVDTDDDEEDDE